MGPRTTPQSEDEHLFKRIFRTMQSAYFFTTPAGDIKMINPVAVAMFG